MALRPDIAAVLLDSSEPAAAQIAKALEDRTLASHSGFAGVHVLAHGASGEVAFAAGPLSLETIDEHRASLAAIGPALAKDGEVLLWSDGAPARRVPLIALGIATYTGVMAAINWLGLKGQAD